MPLKSERNLTSIEAQHLVTRSSCIPYDRNSVRCIDFERALDIREVANFVYMKRNIDCFEIRASARIKEVFDLNCAHKVLLKLSVNDAPFEFEDGNEKLGLYITV